MFLLLVELTVFFFFLLNASSSRDAGFEEECYDFLFYFLFTNL